jgi:hypothetical protein
MAGTRRQAATCLLALAGFASNAGAESWCDTAPPPEFAALPRSDAGDEWFTVYAVSPGVFAINEPRQYEGVTSFLVTGSQRAVLFDSGLGVAAIRAVVRRLTPLPVTVVNSHTHFDHVGGNREFDDVRNLDAPYSRASARGEVAQSLADYADETLSEDRWVNRQARRTRSTAGETAAGTRGAGCGASTAARIAESAHFSVLMKPMRGN